MSEIVKKTVGQILSAAVPIDSHELLARLEWMRDRLIVQDKPLTISEMVLRITQAIDTIRVEQLWIERSPVYSRVHQAVLASLKNPDDEYLHKVMLLAFQTFEAILASENTTHAELEDAGVRLASLILRIAKEAHAFPERVKPAV